MERITELIESLQTFNDNINEYLQVATREAEDVILDMNRSQMYDEGIDRNGNAIQPPYAPATIQYKRRKGQPTNRVTLRDKGDFHLSLYIEYDTDGFEIKDDDFKTPFLTRKYGVAVLGLTDSNVKILADEVYQPRLLEMLKNKLGI